MISFVLSGASVMSIAAGIYTLAARRLPPIFPTEHGGRGAPEIEPDAVPHWGIGFIGFGLLLGAVTWLVDVYSRST